MRAMPLLSRSVLVGCLLLPAASVANAAEYAFTSYGLGGNAFGAGVTPPPGTYVTTLAGFYSGKIGRTLDFGGVVLNAGVNVDFFTSGVNVLYVPETKLFGGNLGLSTTVPVGHDALGATIGVGPLSASRDVDGWGLGDIVSKLQLGWQDGNFSHTLYLQAVAPTGRYETGFFPIIGLHRPGIDTGLAFTWTDQATKLQFNGAAGFTFNFENTATDYQTGDEFHFEWAIGRELRQGLIFGIVGYDYRQLTGDSGSGDLLGSFIGRVDAIGPGLSYTTLIDQKPFIFNLRYYHEFNSENRFEGDSTIASGTMRF